MSESEGRPPAVNSAQHPRNTNGTSASNSERDLNRLDMPPSAAELQASDIHHSDAASPVERGLVGQAISGQSAEAGAGQPSNQSTEDPVLTNFWAAVRRLPSYVRLAGALAADQRVPRRTKVILAVGGAYAVSPIDFVPGIIPIAGQLDDLYVLLTALQQAVRSAPAEVAAAHLERAGLQRTDLDNDLAAVRALVRKAARTSLRVGGRIAKGAGSQVKAMASRSLERGRRAGDNEPL